MILENLGDGSISDRNFQRLASLLIDTGGRSLGVRFGSGTVSFSAASNATVTVTHGLGKTPQYVNVFPTFSTVALVANYVSASAGSTTFQFRLDTRDASNLTASVGYMWLAVG